MKAFMAINQCILTKKQVTVHWVMYNSYVIFKACSDHTDQTLDPKHSRQEIKLKK